VRLAALKSYTTRYRGHDGQERAVMLMKHYDALLALAEKGERVKQIQPAGKWGISKDNGSYALPIGRDSSRPFPILVYGDVPLARRIVRLLNRSEK
jgi:hypothetical protein